MGQEKDGPAAPEATRPISVRSGTHGLLGGAVAATVLTPALDSVTAPFGSHAFTWPFVVTTVPFLAAVPAVPRLRRV